MFFISKSWTFTLGQISASTSWLPSVVVHCEVQTFWVLGDSGSTELWFSAFRPRSVPSRSWKSAWSRPMQPPFVDLHGVFLLTKAGSSFQALSSKRDALSLRCHVLCSKLAGKEISGPETLIDRARDVRPQSSFFQ